MQRHPIYEIKKFNCKTNVNDLYVNDFKSHLTNNDFIENTHSHNFYLLVFFNKGTGLHMIDFDQFEMDIMQKINAAGQAPKRAPIVAVFLDHKQYLVAASLIFAIATGFLFFNTAEKNNAAVAKVEMIQIETLPDELIEAYVNNNELVAEVEWNTVIETEAASLSDNN